MKLIAVDLDGTLLSENGSISEENKLAVIEAQQHGHMVAISSGRALQDIRHILNQSGLNCPILSENGAIIFHGGRVLQKRIIPTEAASDLISMLKNHHYYFELNTKEGIIMEANGKAQLTEEMRRLQQEDPHFPVDWAARAIDIQFEQYGYHFVMDLRELNLLNEGLSKIFVLSFDRQRLTRLREKLTKRTDISITTSGWTKLEIAHPDTSKGRALAEFANYVEIPLAHTIAIGDNINDLSMFKTAGISIAMGNAPEEVKKQSTYTTLSCQENGVAYAIRNFILK